MKGITSRRALLEGGQIRSILLLHCVFKIAELGFQFRGIL